MATRPSDQAASQRGRRRPAGQDGTDRMGAMAKGDKFNPDHQSIKPTQAALA